MKNVIVPEKKLTVSQMRSKKFYVKAEKSHPKWKNNFKRLVTASFVITLLSACISDPKEPDLDPICMIINGERLDCIDVEHPENEPIIIPVQEGIGKQCVSSADFSEILNHHKELHQALKDCRKGR